jgi:hypothetical protein
MMENFPYYLLLILLQRSGHSVKPLVIIMAGGNYACSTTKKLEAKTILTHCVVQKFTSPTLSQQTLMKNIAAFVAHLLVYYFSYYIHHCP